MEVPCRQGSITANHKNLLPPLKNKSLDPTLNTPSHEPLLQEKLELE